MNRKGALVAAGGVSVMLVVGSAAFAVGSGVFASHPVDRVGTFQSIQAGLVAHAEPASTTTAASGSTPPERAEPSARPTHATVTTGPIIVSPSAPTLAPTSAPDVASSSSPGSLSAGEHASVSAAQRTTPTPTARVPSTSVRRPDDDWDREPPEHPHPGSDD